MAFSSETVWQAWLRSKGRCECTNPTHGHSRTCSRQLRWEDRGLPEGWNAWQAAHRTSANMGGDNSLDNCEVLCWKCYKTKMADEETEVHDSKIFRRKWRLNLPLGRRKSPG
jgi:hypothetical protein